MNSEETKIALHILNRRSINLDITHRCPLECPRCQRATSFTFNGLKVPGKDLSMKDFKKILDYFDHINFCGQVSDPVHHPQFIRFLEITREMNKSCHVHHASAGKPYEWYDKAFIANPNARWFFGIDGLPQESHFYRINQDGEKLFNIMKNAKKYLKHTPVWQYIVFRYNENNIEKAEQLAKDINVRFMVLHSSRWLGEDDPYRPLNPEYSLDLRKNE